MDIKIQKKIKKKERELKKIKEILTDHQIMSQMKEIEYMEEIDKIKNEINYLKDQCNEENKTWIETEDGWKIRINQVGQSK